MRGSRPTARDEQLGRVYFKCIKAIWTPIAGSRRVIPFCTPVRYDAPAIVIGTNHSDFVKGGGPRSEAIADAYASGDLTVNTLTCHPHQFAKGFRCVCKRACVRLDERWVGTNRCAIQTGSEGLASIKKLTGFKEAQSDMDALLKDFIRRARPTNVILVGKEAAGLFFDKAKSAIRDLESLSIETDDCRIVCRLCGIFSSFLRIAMSTYTVVAIHIWVLTALSEVP